MATIWGPNIVRGGLVMYHDVGNDRGYAENGVIPLRSESIATTWIDYGSNQANYFIFGDDGVIIKNTSTSWIGRFPATIPSTGYWTVMFDHIAASGTPSIYLDNDGVQNNDYNTTISTSTTKQTFTKTVNISTTGSIEHFIRHGTGSSAGDVTVTNFRYYKTDSSGNSLVSHDLVGSTSGSILAGATYSSLNGGYFTFDGVDDYIHITPAMDWSDFAYVSGSAWIKTTSTSNPNYAFISWNNSSNAGGFNCSTLTGGEFLVSYRDVLHSSGNYPTLTSTTAVNDGNWHYCVFTYNGNSALYVDGELEDSATRNSSMYNISSEVFYLGTLANHPPGNYPFEGSIANVKIYNRGLTATEVLQNYNAYKGRFVL